MSNSTPAFVFPLPPPPPPPPSPRQYAEDTAGRRGNFSNSRGRAQSHGNHRGTFSAGRGRGFSASRGHNGCAANSTSFQPSPASFAQFNHQKVNRGEKRSYGATFDRNLQSRPQAPPAVPSFSAGLEHFLPSKPPTTSAKQGPTKTKTSNILGLTPAQIEGSDSEDYGDEETRLGGAKVGSEIQIEFRGHISTLRTPAEIAAWIAERRKRYPTQAKREAAQKEAEERKARLQEERNARQELAHKSREGREMKRKKNTCRGEDAQRHTVALTEHAPDPKAQGKIRAETLRRKVEKPQQDLATAEEAVHGRPEAGEHWSGKAQAINKQYLDGDSASSVSDSLTLLESDATSSSGSDSDDSAPEETSSKSRPLDGRSNPSPVCTFFAKGGQCRYGKKCRFAHVRTDAEKTESKSFQKSTRKGLWQVMVGRENEEESTRVLRAIIALGDAGMLDEPAS